MEGIREEIRQKAAFRIFHPFDIADQTECCSVAHASNHRIKADGLKLIHKRFRSNPVVTQEHHRLPAAFMADIHHFPGNLGDLSSLEGLEVLVFFGRNTVLVIVIALINNEFRPEFVACFLFELFQDIRGY